MARRPRVFAPGLLYHVIVRGNQRRNTFRSDVDYKAYLDRLEKYRAQCQVRIYAYCLMPNHVHLLVETGNTPLGVCREKHLSGKESGQTLISRLSFQIVMTSAGDACHATASKITGFRRRIMFTTSADKCLSKA